jgi:hypothetical protein
MVLPPSVVMRCEYLVEAKPGFFQITAGLAPSAGCLAPVDRPGKRLAVCHVWAEGALRQHL